MSSWTSYVRSGSTKKMSANWSISLVRPCCCAGDSSPLLTRVWPGGLSGQVASMETTGNRSMHF